jgi:hypothetical protein
MKKNVVFNFLENVFNFLLKKLNSFDLKYPYTSQTIQLTFIYFFALIDLVYSIISNIFSLEYNSENILAFGNIIENILQSTFFKVWASPEKVFFMSYFVLEFLVVRPSSKVSKFIKYNILLVFALLMLQGLLISLWDLLFNKEIVNLISKWAYDESSGLGTNTELAIIVFLFTFFIFIYLYGYFYFNALKRKLVTLPGLTWVTDSVSFWLKIKTSTMDLGEKNKELNDN